MQIFGEGNLYDLFSSFLNLSSSFLQTHNTFLLVEIYNDKQDIAFERLL